VSAQITAIEAQKHNPDRVNIHLDGAYAFSLSTLQAYGLRVGQSLSPERIQSLQDQEAYSRALERALGWIARRPHSAAEIRQKLKTAQVADEISEAVLARLQELHYVDDRVFAQQWVKNRGEFHPRSKAHLRQELRQKGIADEIISEALAEVDSGDVAYRAAKSKAARLRGQDRRAFQQGLGQFLARRGFAYETVQKVVDRLWEEGQAQTDEDNEN
jgi:regulatory protein